MRKYGEELIKELSTELDTGIICSAINVCGKNDHSSVEIISQDEMFSRNRRSNQKLLGSRKCTWGPTYWCENEDQANECHVCILLISVFNANGAVCNHYCVIFPGFGTLSENYLVSRKAKKVDI